MDPDRFSSVSPAAGSTGKESWKGGGLRGEDFPVALALWADQPRTSEMKTQFPVTEVVFGSHEIMTVATEHDEHNVKISMAEKTFPKGRSYLASRD